MTTLCQQWESTWLAVSPVPTYVRVCKVPVADLQCNATQVRSTLDYYPPCLVLWSASVTQTKIRQGIVCHPSTSVWGQDHDNSLPTVRKYSTLCYASCRGRMNEQSASSRPTDSINVRQIPTALWLNKNCANFMLVFKFVNSVSTLVILFLLSSHMVHKPSTSGLPGHLTWEN